MEIQKNSGIVLNSRRMGESDSICTIFTRESGKRTFIFKGLKKSKKRPLSADTPGTFLDIVYYYHPAKNNQIANEFSVNKNLNSIRKDLTRIYHLFFLLEVVDKTTGFNQKNKQLFDTIEAGINTLKSTSAPLLLSVFLCIHLLRFHGIYSSDFSCKLCGSHSYTSFILDLNDLMPICSECIKERSTPFLDKTSLKFMKEAREKKFRQIEHMEFNDDELKKLLFSILLFIEQYYSVEIKSKRFILEG